MKKILKPHTKEDVVYYSDFDGSLLTDEMIPCEVSIVFSYPSKLDGESFTLHLTDKEAKNLMVYIDDRLTQETKLAFQKIIQPLKKESEETNV